MKFGLFFASTVAFDSDTSLELCKKADSLGFDSVWGAEHVIRPSRIDSAYPYTADGVMPGETDSPIPDPLIWLANAGRKALTLQTIPASDGSDRSGLVSKNSGFSLHAGVAFKAKQRKKLEQICRYIARPAISEQRLSLTNNGDIVYALKTPYSDGTTHTVLSPLEFMGRLAALVPKPRINLTRFHGVFHWSASGKQQAQG